MPYTYKDIEKLFYFDVYGRVRNIPGNTRRKAHKTVDNRICYKGYRRVRFRKDGIDHTIGAHRVVFILKNGYIPDQVDHIDMNKSNNRPENLREANNQQNQWNVTNKRAGIEKGVNFIPGSGNWMVRICTQAGRKVLGTFNDLELANLVSKEAQEKYHGKYAGYYRG